MNKNKPLNIDIDFSAYEDMIAEQTDRLIKDKIKSGIHYEFHTNFSIDPIERKPVRHKGRALQAIEEKITALIESERFQKKLEKMFEEKWEEVFTKAIEAAIMHKARGFAFNKIPEYEGIMADLIKKAAKASDE